MKRTKFLWWFPGLLALLLLMNIPGSAQGFRGIVPLESTCEDVKNILKVEECTFPQSVYLLKDFWVTINFTGEQAAEKQKLCYRVPARTVLSIGVSYSKPLPISEFEHELTYVKGPLGDIATTTYENKEKGITVLANLGRINTVQFSPTPDQTKKYGYECQCP